MTRIRAIARSELFKIALGAAVFLLGIILGLFGLDTASSVVLVFALVISGIGVFMDAVRGILRRDLLDEKFLMSIASVGAVIIGEYTEGAAVMLFFLVGEYFEHRAVRRSRSSIRALMDICPDEATVLEDGTEHLVDAEDVAPGSTIVIRPGERVPIDCTVLEGSSHVDTSMLTGESEPRSVREGDTLESGVVVLNGYLVCKTLRAAAQSAASRVLALVESASERKSREESFITAFSRIYTPAVVIAAICVAIFLPIFGINSWSDAVYKALMFLVISCPCALVISVPMAFFGGIGRAASEGILFKGGNVFSSIAEADTFAFDKTGTLTTGAFSVTEVLPIGTDSDTLLRLAASAEYYSNHPVAMAIIQAAKEKKPPDRVEEIAGKGVISTVDSHLVAVGNSALMSHIGISSVARTGEVLVALDGVLIGRLTVSDAIKPEARGAISDLKALGVKRTLMLSGDTRQKADAVAREVGIDEVYAELLPEDKFSHLEKVIKSSRHTAFVGDGINDAPSLALADVGIAMGALGQDSAVEAADAVIMSDNLEKLPRMIKIARKTLRIAKENIILALGVKGLVMILSVLGIANMWLAVIADVGVAVLAILNSMRTLVGGRRG